jgi:tRNA (guanine-N7-)-methyltransferase
VFLKSFVKRKRPLSKAKQLLFEKTLPTFKIKLEEIPDIVKKHDKLNLEIGFGKGDFLSALATEKEKQALNIGCEPYVEGVIGLLQKIESDNIKNIMIWPDDARILISKLPSCSIDSVYILFPDPWPKRKQQKRRLINAQFIKLMIEKLKPSGKIFTATDHHEYANWILHHFERSKAFIYRDISSDSTKLFDVCSTSYHKKNLEGKKILIFSFQLV